MSEIVKTGGLTNSQIFEQYQRGGSAGLASTLNNIQRQIGFVMAQDLERKACPNCGEAHNVLEASGVTDVDAYDFAAGHGDRKGPCRACGRTLIFTLPMMGGWHWRLDPAEARSESEEK